MEEEILPATNINPPNMLPADSAVSAASTGAADVYSAANIAAAISTPMKMPNLKDPMKLRTDIQTALGIPSIQQNVNNLLAQINDATKQAAAQNTYLGNQPVAMPVITGQQAYANRLNTDKINALTGNLNVQNAYLGQLQNEASARTAIALNEKAYIDELRMANPAAGIKYGDSRTKIAEKIRKANYKNALRIETRALYKEVFKTTPKKGMSVREQQRALEKAGVENRAIDLAKKRADIDTLKGKTTGGGYTDQELRRIREAGINPNDIPKADAYLYGKNISKNFSSYAEENMKYFTTGAEGFIDGNEFLEYRNVLLQNAVTAGEIELANKKILQAQKRLSPGDKLKYKSILSNVGIGTEEEQIPNF